MLTKSDFLRLSNNRKNPALLTSNPSSLQYVDEASGNVIFDTTDIDFAIYMFEDEPKLEVTENFRCETSFGSESDFRMIIAQYAADYYSHSLEYTAVPSYPFSDNYSPWTP